MGFQMYPVSNDFLSHSSLTLLSPNTHYGKSNKNVKKLNFKPSISISLMEKTIFRLARWLQLSVQSLSG